MYEKARRYLKIYYDKVKNKIPEYKDFESFVYHYRVDHFLLENYGELIEHDDFLEAFDKALDIASHDDIMNAIDNLASQTKQNTVPTSQDFFNALIDSVQSFSFEDLKGVVKKSSQQVAQVAVAGVGLYLAIGLGSLLFVMVATRK
jgi:hypothetical protein